MTQTAKAQEPSMEISTIRRIIELTTPKACRTPSWPQHRRSPSRRRLVPQRCLPPPAKPRHLRA
jgi:hypothetical protein